MRERSFVSDPSPRLVILLFSNPIISSQVSRISGNSATISNILRTRVVLSIFRMCKLDIVHVRRTRRDPLSTFRAGLVPHNHAARGGGV